MMVVLSDLQRNILRTIAESKEPLVSSQIAEIHSKDRITIYQSVKNLIEKHFLTFKQEYPRGRKWLRFTELGVWSAIAYSGVDYSLIYLNHHQYLEYTFLFDLFEESIKSVKLRNEIYGFLAGRITADFQFFDDEGKLLLGRDSVYDHFLAAMIIDAIDVLFSESPKLEDISKSRLYITLKTALAVFTNSVEVTLNNIKEYDGSAQIIKKDPSYLGPYISVQRPDLEEALKKMIKKFAEGMPDTETIDQGLETTKNKDNNQILKSK